VTYYTGIIFLNTSKEFVYEVDRGDGRWILRNGNDVIYSTKGTEIAFLF